MPLKLAPFDSDILIPRNERELNSAANRKNTFNAEEAESAEPDVISLRVLRELRVKLSGWVGLFPDLPFTGLRRKLFAGGLKFRVLMSGTFFAKPSNPGLSRFEDVSRRSRRERRNPN